MPLKFANLFFMLSKASVLIRVRLFAVNNFSYKSFLIFFLAFLWNLKNLQVRSRLTYR